MHTKYLEKKYLECLMNITGTFTPPVRNEETIVPDYWKPLFRSLGNRSYNGCKHRI